MKSQENVEKWEKYAKILKIRKKWIDASKIRNLEKIYAEIGFPSFSLDFSYLSIFSSNDLISSCKYFN